MTADAAYWNLVKAVLEGAQKKMIEKCWITHQLSKKHSHETIRRRLKKANWKNVKQLADELKPRHKKTG